MNEPFFSNNVYTTRRRYSGMKSANKLFWNEFVDSEWVYLREQQEKIFDAISRRGYTEEEIPEIPAFRSMEESSLKIIFDTAHYVPMEMFLYSCKAVEGLLPDGVNPRPKQRPDPTYAYACLLAKWIDRSIEFVEAEKEHTGCQTMENPSVEAFCHILRDWPKTPSWYYLIRLAILVYGEMTCTVPEIEEELFKALGRLETYQAAYESLILAEDNREHDEIRLNQLLGFICKVGSFQNDADDRRVTDEMYAEFESVIVSVEKDDPELFERLRTVFIGKKLNGRVLLKLNRCFDVEEEDPLESVAGQSIEQQVKYVRRHYQHWDRKWRKWLEKVASKELFDAVRMNFEESWNSLGISDLSFYLNAFAAMERKELGRRYLLSMNEPASLFYPRTASEQVILMCALQLSAASTYSVENILDEFEAVNDQTDITALRAAVMLVCNNAQNCALLQKRMDMRIRATSSGNYDAMLSLLDLLWKYDFRNEDIKRAIMPLEIIMRKIEECCHLDPVSGRLSPVPSQELFIRCVDFVESTIGLTANDQPRRDRLYKTYLLAVRQTYLWDRAEQLIRRYWSRSLA